MSKPTGTPFEPDRVDTLGMWDVTLALPEQVEAAIGVADGIVGLPDHDDIENVVVLGMGGSGIAGDLMIAVAGPFMATPIVVVKGYEVPNFVGPKTLCFALSFSGNTEETIESATAAADAGARMVVVAAGGELAALAGEWGAPLIGLPDDIPMPRAGLGAMAIPTLAVLEDVGLFPGAREWARLTVEQLKVRRDELAKADSSATALAQRIGRTFPLIYGGGGLGGVAALRWKNQVVENAKCPSFCAQVPELMHNDIAGWGQHGDVTRQVMTIVNLRHDHEHPQLARRFELVREWTDEAVAGIEEVTAAGDGALAQLFDLMFQGDVTALHLAYQAGVDPGPIPVLDAIKAALNA
ncbi:MAG: SIS domain-containing protein [Acidimicrobiales bacterium]